MTPIIVEINGYYAGIHDDPAIHIQNLWHFSYDKDTRVLYLTGYTKRYRTTFEDWQTDTRVMPYPGDDCDAKLLEALGPDHDAQKVLLIARAKCLESDAQLRYNEIDCISVQWWQPTSPPYLIPKCDCGNPEMGFNCICDWVLAHPGTAEFSCEYCGIYNASEPQCSECEAD